MSDPLNSSVVEPTVTVDRPVLLREAREAAGLHIAALAAALKVPVKKLEALEAGRYNELPDMTFARALASSACRQLKVDPAPVLAQIPLGHRPQLGDSAQTINTPFKGVGDPAPLNAMGWLSRPAVLAAIALLLGALVLVFLPQRQVVPQTDTVMPPPGAGADAPAPTPTAESSPASAAPLVDNTTAALPAVAPAAAAAPETASPSAASSAVSASAVASSTSIVQTVTSTIPAPVSPTAAAAGAAGSLLSITATGDSWVEVVNGAGSVVMKRMLKKGDAIDFSTAPPYTVVLGRADAVQVAVRGKPFDTAPYARNSVARFEVK
jgi:cytoskeleton protein RodZ